MPTFLIATRNAHKVGEIKAVLGTGFDFLTLNDFPGVPAVVEDADTFAGNAMKKALELSRWLAGNPGQLGRAWEKILPPLYVLADDSGLEVDALHGAPGAHSARFAADGLPPGQNAPDKANNAKLLNQMANVPPEKRTGRFRCVIALAPVLLDSSTPNRVCYAEPREFEARVFEGTCEGRLIATPRGAEGFGYDPLFIPAGFNETFAELGESTKNQISHRSKALASLLEHFRSFN